MRKIDMPSALDIVINAANEAPDIAEPPTPQTVLHSADALVCDFEVRQKLKALGHDLAMNAVIKDGDTVSDAAARIVSFTGNE